MHTALEIDNSAKQKLLTIMKNLVEEHFVYIPDQTSNIQLIYDC